MRELHCKNLTLYLRDGALSVGGGKGGRLFPPFFLCMAGRHDGASAALTTQGNRLPEEFQFAGEKDTGNCFTLRYVHQYAGLEVECSFFYTADSSVVVQRNTVKNIGTESVTVTHFSSGLLNGIGQNSVSLSGISGNHLHCIRQNWEGEGQRKTFTLEEAGIQCVSTHPVTGAFHLYSKGSYTTGTYFPEIFFEEQSGKIWFIGLEAEGNWHLECGYLADYPGDVKGEGYYLEADGVSIRHNDSWYTLAPGESRTAPAAFFGCGINWDSAAAELVGYRRRSTHITATAPLVFNDYMDCLWGNPSKERLLPLIDSAAELGAEIFCMDAGWYCDGCWGDVLGDWNPTDKRYGDMTFAGVVRYIREKGMQAGCWMEMEVCGEKAELYRKPDSWFLIRFGKRIGGGSRVFLNMTNPEVRDYLTEKVRALYEIGIRYIKNDYNDCVGNGCSLSDCPAEGVAENHRAAMSFYEELQRRFVGLQIENCGSGAMRCDDGTLQSFVLQSTSDQEHYQLYPSIVQGMGMMVAPEKMGIWAYPYPQEFEQRNNENIFDESYSKAMQDGEQTVFNMVSGLCGVLYLSGRVDKADDWNKSLIKEGTELYLKHREFLKRAVPVYPKGFSEITDKNNNIVYGLTDGERMLLAVWRREGNAEIEVDIGKYFVQPEVSVYYPRMLKTDFSVLNGKLKVVLLGKNSARMFEIRNRKN